MGYFSNGTEGEAYEEKYCERCVHFGNEEEGCPVWYLHLIYNYDECNKKNSFLHVLIPRGEIYNEQCAMFINAQERGASKKKEKHDD